MPKNQDLTLTGTVFDRDGFAAAPKTDLVPATSAHREDEIIDLPHGVRMAIVPAEPGAGPAPGDVSLYCKSDMYGRSARAGRNTNYGYSGYYRASIFDGKAWRNFKIWNWIPEVERQYETQGDKLRILQELVKRIAARAGATAAWGDRTYELGTQD